MKSFISELSRIHTSLLHPPSARWLPIPSADRWTDNSEFVSENDCLPNTQLLGFNDQLSKKANLFGKCMQVVWLHLLITKTEVWKLLPRNPLANCAVLLSCWNWILKAEYRACHNYTASVMMPNSDEFHRYPSCIPLLGKKFSHILSWPNTGM